MEKYDLGLNSLTSGISATPDVSQNTSEKLDLKVRVAEPADWEAYKKLRLMAVNGKDAEMFNSIVARRDKIKTDEDWKRDLSRKDNMFFVLAWNGNEEVGMGKALDKGRGVWNLSSGYVQEKFQGKGIGKKLWITRIKEIKRRGGLKVVTSIKNKNAKSLGVARSLGFKEIGFIKRVIRIRGLVVPIIFQGMELDLTDPEVIKRIDEV